MTGGRSEGSATALVRGKGILIGIDGPAGSGKSTVSRMVAKALDIGFLDTGAMYRSLTWYCLSRGIDVSDAEAVLAAAAEMEMSFEGTVDEPVFLVNGRDVTAALRTAEVSEHVSTVAGMIPVRKWMVRAQREHMMRARENGRGMVAEGRDVTTVICPDADVRVLLTADEEARIRRRTLEMYGDVAPELMAKTRALVAGRDQIDSRVSQFMEPAPGVTVVDSSNMTISEVVAAVTAMAVEAVGSRGV